MRVSVERVGRLGDAEVDHLDDAVIGDEDVLRAHVAVDDVDRRSVEIAQVVRVMEPGERVAQDANLERQRHLVVPHAGANAAERLAVEVLHGDEERAPSSPTSYVWTTFG